MLSGPSLAKTCYERGVSRYISSLRGEKRLGKTDTLLRDAGLESLLAIPLTSKETTKGVLLLGHTQPGNWGWRMPLP